MRILLVEWDSDSEELLASPEAKPLTKPAIWVRFEAVVPERK